MERREALRADRKARAVLRKHGSLRMRLSALHPLVRMSGLPDMRKKRGMCEVSGAPAPQRTGATALVRKSD